MKKTPIMAMYDSSGEMDINMESKQIPVKPSKADLTRGYVKCPQYKDHGKSAYSNYFDAQDEAVEVDGFVRRSNYDERL